MKSILLFFISTGFLIGCDKISNVVEPSAKDIAIQYAHAVLNGDAAKGYDLLCDSNRQAITKGEYIKNHTLKRYQMALTTEVSIKPISVHVSEKQATVVLEMTAPDYVALFPLISGTLSDAETSETADAATAATIKEFLAKGSYNIRSEQKEFSLVRESSGWKVIDAQIAEERERNEYRENVKIYDFVAKRYDPISQKNMPRISFKIKNEGNRSLDRIEITAYFQDKNSNIIYEESLYPVFVSSASYFNEDKPLKPGYIWQQEPGQFYTLPKVPSEWVEEKTIIKVTSIRFSTLNP